MKEICTQNGRPVVDKSSPSTLALEIGLMGNGERVGAMICGEEIMINHITSDFTRDYRHLSGLGANTKTIINSITLPMAIHLLLCGRQLKVTVAVIFVWVLIYYRTDSPLCRLFKEDPN